MSLNLQTLEVLTSWTKRTEMILDRNIFLFKLIDSRDLQKSLRSRVIKKSMDMLEAQLEFLVRGRFQDMGAGSTSRKLESREGNAELLGLKTRKPRKWYSRAYYARINDLQGVMGFKLMEEAIDAVKEPLDKPL